MFNDETAEAVDALAYMFGQMADHERLLPNAARMIARMAAELEQAGLSREEAIEIVSRQGVGGKTQ